jgi:hypothetical protein
MNCKIAAIYAVLCAVVFASAKAGSDVSQGTSLPRIVQELALDWDFSGETTHFSLERRSDEGLGEADRLIIRRKDRAPWVLNSGDDSWRTIVTAGKQKVSFENQHVVKSALIKEPNLTYWRQESFFLTVGAMGPRRTYLVLIGAGFGCCNGQVTILTPNENGVPAKVFSLTEFALSQIVASEGGTGIKIIGRSSDSESWGKNAESYDPYRIYLVTNDKPAVYSKTLSKAYTETHYCPWVGPDYNEKYAAVTTPKGCRTMTEEQFRVYTNGLSDRPQ